MPDSPFSYGKDAPEPPRKPDVSETQDPDEESPSATAVETTTPWRQVEGETGSANVIDTTSQNRAALVERAGIESDDPRVQSNPERGRFDYSHETYDQALETGRRFAGDMGDNPSRMFDPETGTLIGERSEDGLHVWRIDSDHVNWYDWSEGKKGSGGLYGHEWFPPDQSGPHSQYIGYADWQRRESS